MFIVSWVKDSGLSILEGEMGDHLEYASSIMHSESFSKQTLEQPSVEVTIMAKACTDVVKVSQPNKTRVSPTNRTES